MKKSTLLSLLLCVCLIGFAQRNIVQLPIKHRALSAMKTFEKKNAGKKFKFNKQEGKTAAARKAPAKAPGLVTPPADLTTETWTLSYAEPQFDANGFTGYENYTAGVQVGFSGSDVYIQGLCDYFLPEAWVKGSISGNTITLPTGQYLGAYEFEDGSYDFYFLGIVDETEESYVDGDVTLTLSDDQTTMTTEDWIYIADHAAIADAYYYFQWATNVVLTKGEPVKPEVVTPPAGLETETWIFSYSEPVWDAIDGFTDEYDDYTGVVKVGFDGSDIYIQGLIPFLPDAWVKGSVSDGIVTIPSGQYLGDFLMYGLYFLSYGSEVNANMTFTLSDNRMTSDDILVINIGGATSLDPLTYYFAVELVKPGEGPATPVAPEIFSFEYKYEDWKLSANILLLGTEDEALIPDYVTYKIYTEIGGEQSVYTFKSSVYKQLDGDMTEIPYSFTDDWNIYESASAIYFYDDAANFDKIGIQVIYNAGGETHESEITWYTIRETDGIQNVSLNDKGQTTTDKVYDLQGRQVKASAKGLYIKNGRKFIVK